MKDPVPQHFKKHTSAMYLLCQFTLFQTGLSTLKENIGTVKKMRQPRYVDTGMRQVSVIF